MGLPIFKGESDPEEFLVWESAYERVFQVTDLTEQKKSCYVIAHFERYATTWWEYVKHFGNVLIEGQPPPWFRLRYIMRQRYLPEIYQHKLLAKLYNLKQGNKNMAAYYDEFQQLILKLDHRGE